MIRRLPMTKEDKMEEKVLKAVKREKFGKESASKLRRDGFTPVVLYGKEYESTGLYVNTLELNRFLAAHSVGARLEVEIDGKKEMAIVKEIQRHPVRRDVLHVDFQHLKAGQKIRVTLPISFINQDKVQKGLIIQKLIDAVNVETMPRFLVEHIEVDLDGLGIGSTITIADIDANKYTGIDILEDPATVVATIVEPSKYDEETASTDEEAVETAEAE